MVEGEADWILQEAMHLVSEEVEAEDGVVEVQDVSTRTETLFSLESVLLSSAALARYCSSLFTCTAFIGCGRWRRMCPNEYPVSVKATFPSPRRSDLSTGGRGFLFGAVVLHLSVGKEHFLEKRTCVEFCIFKLKQGHVNSFNLCPFTEKLTPLHFPSLSRAGRYGNGYCGNKGRR
ncbi:hypothetical protein F2P79_010241 [Pimephales promelas]|nr:hypothetical protein F2P79_010241 [Pimephales promelas]